MTRLLVTLSLLLLLIGTATWEHLLIDRSYSRLADDLGVLVAVMREQVEEARAAGIDLKDAKIDTPENMAKAEAMYKFWRGRERRLVTVTRHFDLAQISDALIYMKNFIEFGNAEEAFAGARRLQYLIEAHLSNFAPNIQNVI